MSCAWDEAEESNERRITMRLLTNLLAMGVMALLVSPAQAGCGACGTHDKDAKGTDKAGDDAACAVCSADAGDVVAPENAGAKTDTAVKVETKESLAEISSASLKVLLESGVPLVLLDARSGKYDDGKRIPGARSLNVNSTKEEISEIIKDKNGLIVTYCSNLQCPASAALARHLKELGYSNVLEYSPGIAGWLEAGNQVETVKK
jgi:rhodanese-related sulfurtransferase